MLRWIFEQLIRKDYARAEAHFTEGPLCPSDISPKYASESKKIIQNFYCVFGGEAIASRGGRYLEGVAGIGHHTG